MAINFFVVNMIGLLFALSANAQSLLGARVEFPVRNGNSLTVSPSGNHFAVVSAFSCLLFVVNQESDRWLGPFSAPNGGYFGIRTNPDIDLPARRKLPLYSWTLLPSGEEALVLNPITNRAVTLSGDAIQEISTSSRIEWQLLDAQTNRLRKFGSDAPDDIVERMRAKYLQIRGPASATKGFVSQNASTPTSLPDASVGISDFSPQHDRVLYRPTRDDPLTSLNLKTGERIPFPIHRPDRGLARFSNGSFSPDGEYVLAQYSYGHLDHYGGGFLLLFSKDGKFIEEVAEFHDDVGQPVGFHAWLNNNWIVYYDGKELVFRKFIGP